MAKVSLTESLRRQYVELFTSCVVSSSRAADVERLVDQLVANRPRYEAVTAAQGVPWHVIAVIHNMESGQRFSAHLHNGDPLTARTVHVPAGRPKTGQPPFSWEDSAADALGMKGLGAGTDWTLAGTLYQIERYNGFGYRQYHPHVLSPYLWSFSNHYTRGKYTADGTWSDTATSAQCGAAVLLRRMTERRLFGFADQPLPLEDRVPLVVSYATTRPSDPAVLAQATALQQWLTGHTGIFLKPDGIAGPATSAAYRQVTGHYLPGDPRAA